MFMKKKLIVNSVFFLLFSSKIVAQFNCQHLDSILNSIVYFKSDCINNKSDEPLYGKTDTINKSSIGNKIVAEKNYRIGRFKMLTLKPSEAEKFFRISTCIQPDNVKYIVSLGEAILCSGQLEKSIEIFSFALGRAEEEFGINHEISIKLRQLIYCLSLK